MQFKGESVVSGEASGRLCIVTAHEFVAHGRQVQDIDKEMGLIKRSKQAAIGLLKLRYEKTKESLGLAVASIIEGYLSIIEDISLEQGMLQLIQEQRVSAADAVSIIAKQMISKFDQMKDPYMRGRAVDMQDVFSCWFEMLDGCTAIASAKQNRNDNTIDAKNQEDIILYGKDIMVSHVLKFDFKSLSGIVCEEGSFDSHTAVIAATLEIPMMIHLSELNYQFKSLKSYLNGRIAHIKTETGTLIIEDTARHSR